MKSRKQHRMAQVALYVLLRLLAWLACSVAVCATFYAAWVVRETYDTAKLDHTMRLDRARGQWFYNRYVRSNADLKQFNGWSHQIESLEFDQIHNCSLRDTAAAITNYTWAGCNETDSFCRQSALKGMTFAFDYYPLLSQGLSLLACLYYLWRAFGIYRVPEMIRAEWAVHSFIRSSDIGGAIDAALDDEDDNSGVRQRRMGQGGSVMN